MKRGDWLNAIKSAFDRYLLLHNCWLLCLILTELFKYVYLEYESRHLFLEFSGYHCMEWRRFLMKSNPFLQFNFSKLFNNGNCCPRHTWKQSINSLGVSTRGISKLQTFYLNLSAEHNSYWSLKEIPIFNS